METEGINTMVAQQPETSAQNNITYELQLELDSDAPKPKRGVKRPHQCMSDDDDSMNSDYGYYEDSPYYCVETEYQEMQRREQASTTGTDVTMSLEGEKSGQGKQEGEGDQGHKNKDLDEITENNRKMLFDLSAAMKPAAADTDEHVMDVTTPINNMNVD